MLQKQHDKLIKSGYIFLGWRGIHPTKHQKRKELPNPVSVDDYLRHNKNKNTRNNANFADKFYNNGETWQGLYLATFVDVCYGYVDELNYKRMDINQENYLPWIFRVYLKKTDIEAVKDVRMWTNGDASPKNFSPEEKPKINSEYIYFGREGPNKEEYLGFEMVLSPSVAQKARFLLSTFTAKGYTVGNSGLIVRGNRVQEKKNLRKNRYEQYEKTMTNSGKPNLDLVRSTNKFGF